MGQWALKLLHLLLFLLTMIHFHLIATNMQESTWKYYIQFTLKYINLKYIITTINIIFLKYAKVHFFFIFKSNYCYIWVHLQLLVLCSVIWSFVFQWTWHCLQFSNLNLHFQMKSCADLMRNAVTLSACTPLFRSRNSTPVAWVLVAQLGIMFAHASAILPKLLSRGAKHMWKGSS